MKVATVAIPLRKSPRYPFHGRLGGPQSRSGRCEVEKNLLPLPGIELRLLDRPARNSSISRLSYPGSEISSREINASQICATVLHVGKCPRPEQRKNTKWSMFQSQPCAATRDFRFRTETYCILDIFHRLVFV
jgi:hypothetical protein